MKALEIVVPNAPEVGFLFIVGGIVGDKHHGVLVTQNTNRLARATHTTLTVENGKVVDRKAENIAIRGRPGPLDRSI